MTTSSYTLAISHTKLVFQSLALHLLTLLQVWNLEMQLPNPYQTKCNEWQNENKRRELQEKLEEGEGDDRRCSDRKKARYVRRGGGIERERERESARETLQSQSGGEITWERGGGLSGSATEGE